MMKIQIEHLDGQVILHVEGRLAAACVPELESVWNTARASHPEIAVDLKNVTCVDRAGRALLQSMHGNGVVFLRAGMAIQDILEEIRQQTGQALSPANR
jgi:anti-anti-sigma regulatory factor